MELSFFEPVERTRMSETRRNFLNFAVAAGGGLSGAVRLMAQQTKPAGQMPGGGQGSGQEPASGSRSGDAEQAAPLRPAAEVQVPKMKFGSVEMSRLVCGENQFYGYAHFNQILSGMMQEYYTPGRVCDLLHQCNRFGINAVCFHSAGRGTADMQRFRAEGGKMHLIAQGLQDPSAMIKEFNPLAVYYHGSLADRAFQDNKMSDVKEWCKRLRDTGVMVGVGTHKPEVIALVEEQGWDVDFYAGCVYNRTRTQEEWAKVLSGELVELQEECYLKSDPPRMYSVMRKTQRPCFAFKILAAGRITNVEQAFRTAYESIKPTDGVIIGMIPFLKDEVRENSERVHRILVGA
jgi:hypothetical protein